MTAPPARLLVYDDTCRGSGSLPGLTHTWVAGAVWFRYLDRFDAVYSAESWQGALVWLATVEPERQIVEIQFWGHGKWGRVLIDGDPLEVSDLGPSSKYRAPLESIKRRMSGVEALWWFRTCETFGGRAGHEFARRWTDFFECRVASHTYIIGPWQSGLHVLAPGEAPDWSLEEGLAEGTPEEPERAEWSTPMEPNTVFCLTGRDPSELV